MPRRYTGRVPTYFWDFYHYEDGTADLRVFSDDITDKEPLTIYALPRKGDATVQINHAERLIKDLVEGRQDPRKVPPFHLL